MDRASFQPQCLAGTRLYGQLDQGKRQRQHHRQRPLLFSNPNTTKGRNHITIKASLDGGLTWPTEHQVLLDEAEGWGYSCLSMIDKETVGIFYESSVAHMTFQAIKLTDLIP